MTDKLVKEQLKQNVTFSAEQTLLKSTNDSHSNGYFTETLEHAFLPYQDEEVKPVGVLKNTATSVLQGILGTSPFDSSSKSQKVRLEDLLHLIVTGKSGSGKTTAINTFLTSIMYHSTPQEVQFLIADPKIVEYRRYNKLPYMMAQTITSTDEAYIMLKYLIELQKERYQLMDKVRTKNLAEYNKLALDKGLKLLPEIVCVIDEFDFLMAENHDIITLINLLVQEQQACGIHLIVVAQTRQAYYDKSLVETIQNHWAFQATDKKEADFLLVPEVAELDTKGDYIFKNDSQTTEFVGRSFYISGQSLDSVFENIADNYSRVSEVINVYTEFEKLYIKHHEDVKCRDDILKKDGIGKILDIYYKSNPEIAEKSLAELKIND